MRINVETLKDGWIRHTWRLDEPHSAYLFGFAAGSFQTTQCAAPVFLLATEMKTAGRAAICARYPAMVRFFKDVAGMPYPLHSFTVAFANEGLPQEAAGYAILPRLYADSVIATPQEDYLLAHELAHAWWGNWITCADWREFWLNEGMTTFLTSAFKQRLWGDDEYDRERFLYRRRMARAAAAGKVRALVPAAISFESAGGTVPYAQGPLVLHLLRTVAGERAFWSALRAYTRDAARSDRLVRTSDLERAMERASVKDLHSIFQQWAFSSERLQLSARHEITPSSVSIVLTQKQPTPWIVPIRIAIQTGMKRIRRDVVLTRREEVIQIPVHGPVTSVRIDDGGNLPEKVTHPRPPQMLMWQALHEPDALGRAEALEELGALCPNTTTADCADVARVFNTAKHDRARVVREQVPAP